MLLGSSATGKRLADYLSEKIWAPFGMEQHASWILGSTGHEISGCCLQAATRDFARFGQFLLDGGGSPTARRCYRMAGSRCATRNIKPPTPPGAATATSGGPTTTAAYGAQGIFGQGIFVDPKRKVVIVSNANWGGGATDRTASEAREAFYRTVLKAIDDEAAVPAGAPAKP